MRMFWEFFPLLNISKLWKANGIFEIWDSCIQAYIDQIRHLVPPHVQPRVQSWREPEQWIHLTFPWAWIGCSGYKDATFEAELRHLTSSNSPPDTVSITNLFSLFCLNWHQKPPVFYRLRSPMPPGQTQREFVETSCQHSFWNIWHWTF